jgi:hypothetical protein
MESRGLEHRAIARAAVIAIVAAICLLAVLTGPTGLHPAYADTLQQAPPGCRVVCGTCAPVTFECGAEEPPGGNPGDGTPGSTPQPPGGGNDPTPPPPPNGTPQPQPTVAPPPGSGAPGGGYYFTQCMIGEGDWGCIGSAAIVTVYVAPNGESYVVNVRCTTARNCDDGPTPTPRPQPTPVVDPYPCRREPVFGGGIISQPCENGPEGWPGWNLSVSVTIPPVNAARNPWPRSIVGGQTTLCLIGAPDSVERFSDNRARPCNVDRGEHESPSYDCGTSSGAVGDGDRVNFKLGVAWRRYTGANSPGFPGAAMPAYPSALLLEDRDFNGGTTVVPIGPGQCTHKTYQTSSWGLEETFPKWNPECQDRECGYTERVQKWTYTGEACDNPVCTNCTPAYDSPIQTWWWPEWTWRYDEYQCVRQEWSACFYDERQLVGGKFAGCGEGPHAGEADWWQARQCAAWGWRDVIEPWRKYDMRQQGMASPFWRSTRTSFAGMDENRNVRTPFIYPPSVPVIEAQPVAP